MAEGWAVRRSTRDMKSHTSGAQTCWAAIMPTAGAETCLVTMCVAEDGRTVEMVVMLPPGIRVLVSRQKHSIEHLVGGATTGSFSAPGEFHLGWV